MTLDAHALSTYLNRESEIESHAVIFHTHVFVCKKNWSVSSMCSSLYGELRRVAEQVVPGEPRKVPPSSSCSMRGKLRSVAAQERPAQYSGSQRHAASCEPSLCIPATLVGLLWTSIQATKKRIRATRKTLCY